jgi:uncharacterized protein YoxC
MNKIAIIFDFDITLSPYYQQVEIFKKWDIDEDKFWSECAEKMKNGYDMEHSYIKTLIDYANSDKKYNLSNKDLFELGKNITLYDGLSKKTNQVTIFDDINKITQKDEYKEHNIKVEYFIISGGLEEMIKGALVGNNIYKYFKKIFACKLDEKDGIINFPKETIGHTIKTQKLYQIAKGLDKDVNEKVDKLDIPFSNMIYLGDGQTDIPAFSLINSRGGISIAVYREEKLPNGEIDEEKTKQIYNKSYELAIKAKRAEQLLPADYSKGKPLKIALLNYVENICKKIRG